MSALMLANPRRRRRVKRATRGRFVSSKPRRRRRVRRAKAQAKVVATRTVRVRSPRRTPVAVSYSNPRRRRRSRASYRMRRNPRRNGGGGKLSGIFSKDNLTTAAVAVGGTLGAQFVLNKYGSSLPMLLTKDANGNVTGVNNTAKVAYVAALPIVAGLLLRKRSPGIARGLILSGLYNGISVGLATFSPTTYQSLTGTTPAAPAAASTGTTATTSTTGGTGAYLNAPQLRPVNAFPPGYSAMNAFGKTGSGGRAGSMRPVGASNSNGVFTSPNAFRKPFGRS